VHFAWAAPGGVTAARRIFAGSRESVRRQTVALALERLLELVAEDERSV
jgi:nicotinamide mononucleotide (NMN) deamidase PncC